MGVLLAIVYGCWMAQHAFYTDAHVSSTTAISFIYIPVYAVVPGLTGGLFGVIAFVLVNKYRTASH